MATAQTLIDRALRMIGRIAAGASPTADETADALESLNDMIDDWRNERLLVYSMQEETLTLANADASYTIGTSGDLNTTRPVAIDDAWIVVSDVSYKMLPMSEAEYASISDKTSTADWPSRYLYRPTMATGTLIVWPVPNATRTMKLLTRVVLAEFATAATTVSLPPGYRKALTSNLALEIAPEHETEPSQAVIKMARESKASIKRINSRPIKATTDLQMMFGGGHSNILSDQP